MSDPERNLIDLFNSKFEREFISNVDYRKVGGDKQEWTNQDSDDETNFKKFLKHRWIGSSTSVMASL